jgi:hypothetical protein
MQCFLGRGESGELVVGYAARTLDPRAQAGFERHLTYCGICRDAVAAQQVVWDALDEWRAVAVSPDFDRALCARIAREGHIGWWWRRAVPAAAACIALGVSLWLHQTRMAKMTPSAPHVSPQIQELEHALDDMDMLGQLSAGIAPGKAGAPSPI